MSKLSVRHSCPEDYEAILNIYALARQFMRENGNPNQWKDSWPPVDTVRNDIDNGLSYVIVEDGVVKGVFAFIIGDDPTYKVIEGGHWSSNQKYGTIHRIASDGSCKGLAKTCFDFCLTQSSYLRIDTHADNKPMQSAVERFGFRKCGVIYVADGSPRIAYDYIGK